LESIEKIYDDNIEDIHKNFKPYKITNWKISKELKSYEYILAQFNIDTKSDSDDKYWDKYFESKYTPSFGIKLRGTPTYTQYTRNIEENPKLLQMTECTELPYGWGDGGIAHISENLVLECDCY
jgi:hypothetical protein